MKLTKLNVPTYYDKNLDFNSAAEGLVQDIFQNHNVGLIGYITARPSNALTDSFDHPLESPTNPDEHSDDPLERFDLTGVGDYERRILSSLVSAKLSTHVVIGDLGSGKTATMNFITAVLRRPRKRTCGLCSNCNPIVMSLNFNTLSLADNVGAILKNFRWHLYQALRQELRHLFAVTDLTDMLRDEAQYGAQPDGFYAVFDRFAQTHADAFEWNVRAASDKANLLFNYVDECTEKGAVNIDVMMKLLHLAKHKLRSDPACLILVFDNIDSVLPEAQSKILAEILTYQETAGVQSLVALRRTSFANFKENRGARPFGTINHRGPDIKDIVIRRLKYYAENWDSLPEVKAVTNTVYRNAVKVRLNYLLETKDDPHGAIQRVAPICGSSIRLGLFMCERFFINSAVLFSEPPHYKNDIVRAVFLGRGDVKEIEPEDFCIANLLLDKAKGAASLLNIRILQLVMEFGHDTTLKKLLDMLKVVGNWERDQVIPALNYLLNYKRPLIWVEGRTEYNKLTIVRHLEDVLHPTEAGLFYFRVLMLDLVYVQEASLSVNWQVGAKSHIPRTVDYSRASERFKALRCFLEDLASQDYDETKNFMKWTASHESPINPILFINRIINSIGRSALNILLQHIQDSHNDQSRLETWEELRNWRSTVNIWLMAERDLLRFTNRKLQQLSREYRDRVPLKIDQN
jgi:hypothetical protein